MSSANFFYFICLVTLFATWQLWLVNKPSWKKKFYQSAYKFSELLLFVSYVFFMLQILFSGLKWFPKKYAYLSINPFFDAFELSFFLLGILAIFFKPGRWYLLLLSIYSFYKLSTFTQLNIGAYLLSFSLLALVVFFTNLPWIQNSKGKQSLFSSQILISLSALVVIGSILYAVMDLPDFKKFIFQIFGFRVYADVLVLTFVSILFLWLPMLVGVSSRVLLPILWIPSLVTILFLTQNIYLSSLFFIFLVIIWLEHVKERLFEI